MPIAPDDLSRRLEAAARARHLLRRATLEWAALGRAVLEGRRAARGDGPALPEAARARQGAGAPGSASATGPRGGTGHGDGTE